MQLDSPQRIDDFFVEWPGAPDVRTLGFVDFAIFPHLDVFPTNTLDAARALGGSHLATLHGPGAFA